MDSEDGELSAFSGLWRSQVKEGEGGGGDGGGPGEEESLADVAGDTRPAGERRRAEPGVRGSENENREGAAEDVGDEAHRQERGDRAMLDAPTREHPRESHGRERERVGGARRHLLARDDAGGLESGERACGEVHGLLILAARWIRLDEGGELEDLRAQDPGDLERIGRLVRHPCRVRAAARTAQSGET